jgi:hypothetical protein
MRSRLEWQLKIGRACRMTGWVLIASLAMWSVVSAADLLRREFGIPLEWGGLISIVGIPATILIAPLYQIVELGNWRPFIAIYGGSLVGSLLVSIGECLTGGPGETRTDGSGETRPDARARG